MFSVTVAAVLGLGLYYYISWIVRLDARFRRIHPRKIRVTSLIVFYLPQLISAVVLRDMRNGCPVETCGINDANGTSRAHPSGAEPR